ncbi:MAG: archaeal Zn-finger protein [uncultured archaeon A07HB70]|nr:MAG: archaeal Zn-finger protein [uncultured archaeon A07HB70]
MSDTNERATVGCPGCGDRTAHEVLRPGGQATVRCTDCGHTHKTRVERSERVEREVVVSQEGDSVAATRAFDAAETVATGDEFVVDTPAAILQVRVTAVETGPEERTEAAPARDATTVWTRAVDNVGVPVTVHPKEGDGQTRETESSLLRVPGDHEFVVGEEVDVGDDRVEVVGLQIRSDAPEYRHDKLDHEGDRAFARDLKRLYARDARSSAWSVW